MNIPFNTPIAGEAELELMIKSIKNKHISSCGEFTRLAEQYLQEKLGVTGKVILTTSCTDALEMAALLLNLQPGDEVIIPSYTFVSTAVAFAIHGAKPVFADVRSDTLNIDETKLEELISPRTRAIVPVHYAGVGCEMNEIMRIAEKHNLIVIEDNAHGLFGKYRNQYLGTIGHMATQSFHETKNITCGEGGALILNDPSFINRAELIRDKGTNRSNFFRGDVDKYNWVDVGSSYGLSDILAAFLLGQLQRSDQIQKDRENVWNRYHSGLYQAALNQNVKLPAVPTHCEQAFHMFYLLMPDHEHQTALIETLNAQHINAVFHYSPLHSSPMGITLGKNLLDCPISESVAGRLVRLPFFIMPESTQNSIIEATSNFLSHTN